MFACCYSNQNSTENTVKTLIDAGADFNLRNNEGFTALQVAVSNSVEDSTENTVKMLTGAGSYVNIKDSEGWTPLMFGANNSTDNTVKMLNDCRIHYKFRR